MQRREQMLAGTHSVTPQRRNDHVSVEHVRSCHPAMILHALSLNQATLGSFSQRSVQLRPSSAASDCEDALTEAMRLRSCPASAAQDSIMAAESSFSTDDAHPYRIDLAVFVNIPKESPS